MRSSALWSCRTSSTPAWARCHRSGTWRSAGCRTPIRSTTRGYREAFDAIDRWISGIDGLITFGRQGLFAHDNTHHTMAMAYALVDCLGPDGSFDREAWARARTSFESHVVED
jgi:hypothetical protein